MASFPPDDDPDDPLALPLPPHTLLLDPMGPDDPPADRGALALQALRQQLRELGLPLQHGQAGQPPQQAQGQRPGRRRGPRHGGGAGAAGHGGKRNGHGRGILEAATILVYPQHRGSR